MTWNWRIFAEPQSIHFHCWWKEWYRQILKRTFNSNQQLWLWIFSLAFSFQKFTLKIYRTGFHLFVLKSLKNTNQYYEMCWRYIFSSKFSFDRDFNQLVISFQVALISSPWNKIPTSQFQRLFGIRCLFIFIQSLKQVFLSVFSRSGVGYLKRAGINLISFVFNCCFLL